MCDFCFTRSRTRTQIRPQPETTCKIKVACCKRGKMRKSGEWPEDFYGNKTSVPVWYTTFGKSAIAAAGEFELMFTNTEIHKIFVSQKQIKIIQIC